MRTLLLVAVLSLTPACRADIDWQRFNSALQKTETGGQTNPDQTTGDSGKAIGRYQIHRVCWVDACEQDPTLKSGTYEDCRKPEYAARVVRAYLERYGAAYIKAGDAGSLARIWNGGPKGTAKPATEGYAKKFLRFWKAS